MISMMSDLMCLGRYELLLHSHHSSALICTPTRALVFPLELTLIKSRIRDPSLALALPGLRGMIKCSRAPTSGLRLADRCGSHLEITAVAPSSAFTMPFSPVTRQ
jgi:hypothetical protein